MKYRLYTILVFFGLFVFQTHFAASQAVELRLASEYLSKGDFEKAKSSLDKLVKNDKNIPIAYKSYLDILLKMEDYALAEKFVKRAAKEFPENIFYQIDHLLLGENHLKNLDKSKDWKAIEQFIKIHKQDTRAIADYFIDNKKPEHAVNTYLTARKYDSDKFAYTIELATAYTLTGQEEEMIEELLQYLMYKPTQLEEVKNTLQNNLLDKKGFSSFKSILYQKIQKDPEELAFNELLLWINIQEKDFAKALIQAKAIDRRAKSEGNKLLEVGRIALNNKDYENAGKFFQVIVNEYKSTGNYAPARRLLLLAKEETIKNKYPVEINEIVFLINEYKKFLKETGKTQASLEALRNMALLEAFYLNNKDTAIILLQEGVQQSGRDENFKARAKLDLGDIFLLKGEPWESTLLYSQVEKSQKDELLGHEAKLRNAKLSYYKGEFDLAQEHLDVLKLATSREIANDAMNLSILIQDNLALDTSAEALKMYAEVDLMLFQQQLTEALKSLKEIEEKFPGHSLTDEILLLKSKIYIKLGETDNAVQALNEIQQKYSTDILGDDALFMLANVYEDLLHEKEKAMDMYQSFLLKYPGSIFAVEARKKFRSLRGDKL